MVSVQYTVLARIAHNTCTSLHGIPWDIKSCRCVVAGASLANMHSIRIHMQVETDCAATYTHAA
eukprot:15405290-Alexandrium_andersonii.AAC.1